MNRPLIAFDTESATLLGSPHLVELGAVRVVAGEVEDHFESLVRPQVPIEPGATAYHGITNDDVRTAPDAAEVLARFSEWAGDCWLAAHNARADTFLLGFEYVRAGQPAPPGLVLDTLAMARRWLPESPDHKLATLVEFLELECDTSHRALADAVSCWKVYEACLEVARSQSDENEVGEADLIRIAALSGSIGDSGPKRPNRHRSRVRQLEEARDDGRTVRLVYGESEHTPARLEVLPRLVYQIKNRTYLEGEDSHSGLLKTYRMDRIQKVLTV